MENQEEEQKKVSGIKSQEAYEKFKEKELRGTFEELDELRSDYQQAKAQFYKRVEVWVASFLALVGAFFLLFSILLLVFYVLVVVGLFFGYRHYRVGPYRKKYERKFKEELIRPTISFIDEELQYFPRQKISDPSIQESLLFPFSYNIREGDDLVKGSFKGRDLRFSELKLIRKVKDDKSEKKILLFQGLFLVAELEKDLHCTVVIRPKDFGFTQKKLAYGGLNLGLGLSYSSSNSLKDPRGEGELDPVNLEDPAFEEIFDVFGNDQVKARQILNMNALENLKAFQKEHGDAVFLSFQGSKLYTAIEIPGGFLDPAIDPHVKKLNFPGLSFEVPGELVFSGGSDNGLSNEEQLDRFYKDLAIFFRVLEELDPKALKEQE
ncbi:MAG: DUF3137 domain-containing protein [Flavobacteriales bacterium]